MDKTKERYCCPNCQTILPGESKFCLNCGQKRIHPEDHSVWHLITESVGDFFHFDSRFFATLWPLFFRPGFLTGDYLQGKRARYFQPFKLFLFISFLYFLTSGLMNHKESIPDQKVAGVERKTDTARFKNDPDSLKLTLGKQYDKILAIHNDSLRQMVRKYGLTRYVNLNFPRASWYTRFMIKQLIKNRLQGSGTFNENMQKTIPKLIFILIPFIALLLKLLYIRKKIPYFNHIIFSLHFLAFVFLLLWIKLFGSLIINWFNLVVYILLMVYLFIALLRVYHQKMWKTFTKFLLLFFGSMVILAVFYIIAASISFMLI
jgi:hypothetical protein